MIDRAVRRLVRALADVTSGLARATSAYSAAPNVVELPDGKVYVLLGERDGVPRADLNRPNVFLESDAHRSDRSRVALELMDGDVYGFMMVLLKRTDLGPAVELRCQLAPEWNDAFAVAWARIAAELKEPAAGS